MTSGDNGFKDFL